MFQKLLLFGVRKTVRGPAQSWVFTSGMMLLLRWAKRKTERREIVELTNLKPGDKYIIESLHVTHGEQIKAEKQAARSAKSNAKAHKAAVKAARKAARKA
ncbi:MAG: hypothetical protein R2706_17795 [Acidimicrobiales bacterium]